MYDNGKARRWRWSPTLYSLDGYSTRPTRFIITEVHGAFTNHLSRNSRTDRGKLDLKKLPSVKRHASEKPSSELEASLATIFAEVLGMKVGEG